MLKCHEPEVEFGNGCTSDPSFKRQASEEQRQRQLRLQKAPLKGCLTPADWGQDGGRCILVPPEKMTGSYVETKGRCYADALDLVHLYGIKPPFDFVWFRTSEFDASIGAMPTGWRC